MNKPPRNRARRGRPATPPDQARSRRISYRLTPSEYETLLRYRDALGVVGLSDADAARNATIEALRNRGLTT